MHTENVLIIGCGYVGAALGAQLTAQGYTVSGLRRHPDQLPASILPIACDLKNLSQLTLTCSPDYIFYMPSVGRAGTQTYSSVYVEGVHQLSQCIRNNKINPNRLFYISSTSVYGEQEGSWVDEATPPQATSPTALCLLAGETAAYHTGIPTTVVRFGGIYGPGRLSLAEDIQAGKIHYSTEPVYTNRIHQADAAGLLRYLMTYSSVDTLYLGVDCEPTLKNTVIDWLATYLNVSTHGLTSAPIALSERQMRGNKRCSNHRLQQTGYSFDYPSFREGYAACLSES